MKIFSARLFEFLKEKCQLIFNYLIYSMCGICGFMKLDGNSTTASLIEMNDAIRHRGPDDEGYVCLINNQLKSYSGIHSAPIIKKNLLPLPSDLPLKMGMAFSRLSILDLSEHGHQPMLNDIEDRVITFNGEIYNYKELRTELISKGFRFRSNSDTEVILKGYEYWGKEIVNKLNGMFAFSILDLKKEILWLVRDRMGLKPLFYHQSENDITWASEMKSVLKADWVKPEINWDGLTANFYLQTTPPSITCFKNIFSVKPGSWMEINLKSFKVNEQIYWQIPIGNTTKHNSIDEAAEDLEDRLKNIVQLQSLADVPVISLMSGGIDSTTLTALLSDQQPSFQCYTMGFDGSGKNNDELPQAIAMAEKLGIKQRIHIIKSEEILGNIDNQVSYFEEPYCSLEPGLAASKYLHNEGFKVAITGNGADEVFGGYSYYSKISSWNNRRKLQWIESFLLPAGGYLQRAKNYLSLDTTGKYFAHTRQSMQYHDIKELFLPAHQKNISSLDQWLYPDDRFRNTWEAFFYYDLKYSISAHHVFRDDLSAMRYGLEMRYPYLDHSLIEWVASLPLSVRYNDKITKPLLRKTAEKYLIKDNLSMQKKGFSFPMNEWMQNDATIENYMIEQLERLKKREMFNNKTIDKWWQSRKMPEGFLKIWQLVTTEVWLRNYID